MSEELCWADEVGTQWERDGADPGRIFESNLTLPGALPGVMVLTKNKCKPGRPPKEPDDVQEMIVQVRDSFGRVRDEKVVNNGKWRPIALGNWQKIQGSFF